MAEDWPEAGRARRVDGVQQVVALLRSSAVFAGLPTASLHELAGLVRRQHIGASTSVVVDGSVDDAFYIIRSGRFSVEIAGRVVNELVPPDHFGEVAWLYGTPRTASVTALTDGEVLRCSGELFADFLVRHPSARSAIAYEASHRYAGLSDDES